MSSVNLLLSASLLSNLWWWISVILKVSIGLGAVIFVHELGHYLVARLCGVKIEKFMVGFDIGGYKLSWRRGETIYGIGILPLGGYVKMLGQDDDPAHIAEQMKKSELDPNSANAKAITGPDGETYYVDRRSYLAKNVPQRMAIISAGVVMNVIFAFIFAVIAYGMGVPYIPSVVSETVPGSPAWQAGLEPGDEIVRIGNRPEPSFVQLKGGVTLGDLEHGIDCEVRRAANGKVVDMKLTPQQNEGRLATVGLIQPFSLNLGDSPAIKGSPAWQALPTELKPNKDSEDSGKTQSGYSVVRVDDVDVSNYREFSEQLARRFDKPMTVAVRHTEDAEERGAQNPAAGNAQTDKKTAGDLTFEVRPQQLQRFPLAMKMGPITSIRKHSPAEAAGFQRGDVIEKVDGKSLREGGNPLESWDCETLPAYLRRAAANGREVELTVQRTAKNSSPERVPLRVKPEVPASASVLARPPGSPSTSNEIGIAYRVENEVASVFPNSAAAKEGITSGDKIVEAKIVLPKDDAETKGEPVVIKFQTERPGWFGRLIGKLFGSTSEQREIYDSPRLLDAIQFLPAGSEIELSFERASERYDLKMAPVAAEGAFVADRGFMFKPVERIRKAATFADQVRFGWDETTDALTMVFSFLRKLGTQVPISALGGPISIARAAGSQAAEGIPSLLMFLTMLSANLAVLNFLPIPLLDGGHIVFLAYEGIRGRPANEKFVVALHTVGFIFIVSLMLYVLALDLNLIPRSL